MLFDNLNSALSMIAKHYNAFKTKKLLTINQTFVTKLILKLAKVFPYLLV